MSFSQTWCRGTIGPRLAKRRPVWLLSCVLVLGARPCAADSQIFSATIEPGQTREYTIRGEAAGWPINYTLYWDTGVRLHSAIYAPGASEPDASSTAPSPQPVSDITTTDGLFTIRIHQPIDDPPGITQFTLSVTFPTLKTTQAGVVSELRDDPEHPPNRWIFGPKDSPQAFFEVRGGNLPFVDYSLDGGVTYLTISASYVINNGANDWVRAALPALPADTAVSYRLRALAPDLTEGRGLRNVRYLVTDGPKSLAEFPDDPPFYRGSGKAWPSPADWRDQSVYMVMTDRFFNVMPENDRLGYANYNPAVGGQIHGGDWSGLAAKLPYIAALGVTTIWVTPAPQNFEAYHGYAAINFLMPARQAGTLQEFRAFVDAAHQAGLYVILDVVVNHQADLIYHTDSDYTFTCPDEHPGDWIYSRNTSGKPLPYPLELRDLTLFHTHGNIRDFSDQGRPCSEAELGTLSSLDDFRTETVDGRPDVRNIVLKISKWWIANTDVDGFRMDVVKHIELGFWRWYPAQIRDYAASIGKDSFFLTGEFFDGGRDMLMGRYTGDTGLNSLLDFPLYFAIQRVFRDGAPTTQFDGRYGGHQHYPNPQLLTTFIDNHDVTRFLREVGGSIPKLRAALAFLYTAIGIPVLYYGTEQGFDGIRTGDCNREDMFSNPAWSCNRPGDHFDQAHPLFLYAKRLNEIRAAHEPFRHGSQTQRWNSPGGAGLYIFSRQTPTAQVLVVINSANATLSATPQVTTSLLPPGTVLRDELSGREVTTYDAGGGFTRVQVDVGPYGAQIFTRRD